MVELVQRLVPIKAAPWLGVLPEVSRWSLRGGAAVAAAASQALGLALPSELCRSAVQGTRAALCLGPDEHFLLAAARDFDTLRDALSMALATQAHSLVDVSHRHTAFEIVGPYAAWILNGGCPLDLSLRAFPVGMCTRTVFAKAEVMLWRTATETFRFEVWRSYATYCLEMLREISREV